MPTQVSLSQLQKLQKAMELLKLQGQATPRTMDDAKHKKYQFWDTQPVPKLGESVTSGTHSLCQNLVSLTDSPNYGTGYAQGHIACAEIWCVR